MFVANPNNPTGTLVPREHIVQLINDVPEDVLLVMDEAYIEFLHDAVDLMPFIRQGRSNLLLMRTFSKIHGLAGLRLGYGLGAQGLIASLEKARQPFNINALVQAGALAALDDDAHLRSTRDNNAAGLHFFESAFRRLRLVYVPSSANFILVKVGDGARVFGELQKLGIITRPMAGYGLPEWLRISIGTPAENHRCLDALC